MRLTNEEREWLIESVINESRVSRGFKREFDRHHGVSSNCFSGVHGYKHKWKGTAEERPTFALLPGGKKGRANADKYRLKRENYINARKQGASHRQAIKDNEHGLG